MHKVDLREAEARLAELMDEAAGGEEVLIERGDGATFQIVPVAPAAPEDLDGAYAAMARDEAREADAAEWAEALIGDAGDEAR